MPFLLSVQMLSTSHKKVNLIESKVSDLLSGHLMVTLRAAQCKCHYSTAVRIPFTLAVLSQEHFSSMGKYFQVARSNFREGKFEKVK